MQIDGPTSYHSGLVVVDGVIYTNTGRETVALDATTCAVKWKVSHTSDEGSYSPSSRGLAVMGGRVFRGTGDTRLIALDAATGKLLWKNVIGDPGLGEGASAAPLAWQGVVYMGIAGSELGVRGRVMAFDAVTGKELWRFNTIPMGNETGAETWKRKESAKTGGGGVWGAMSVDVTTGELFVPVGNPWPDIDLGYRPGDNLFTDSVVVLDAHTGALKWWHQVAPNDWQDLDMVAAPVLYRDSRIRDLVVIAGKDGYVTGIDRDTRKVVFRTPVTTVEHIYQKPTPQGSKMCPGYAGGVEWNGPGLDLGQQTAGHRGSGRLLHGQAGQDRVRARSGRLWRHHRAGGRPPLAGSRPSTAKPVKCAGSITRRSPWSPASPPRPAVSHSRVTWPATCWCSTPRPGSWCTRDAQVARWPADW